MPLVLAELSTLTSLLQPEDGAERPREKNSLNSSEGNDALGEGRLRSHPRESPVRLVHHGGVGFHGVKELLLLLGLLDVGVDQQRVHLRVDVFHHELEAVEAARLGDLHLVNEVGGEVLVDDSVRRGKER